MRIAVVGAGKGGTNLMKVFQTIKDSEVKVVVDTNSSAEGVQFARQHGIPWEQDIAQIKKHHVDMIVEVTGSPNVASRLEELYSESHTIISSDVAHMFNQMVDSQVELLDKMSRQMDVVQRLAHTFSKEFHQLVQSVESINQLSERLNLAVENSNQYIAKTDEITNSVNKIAMQTKILGLNANIEAARAGEHGKGFAVVANEVQKLSDSSTQFATEISELLKELSNEIQQVNAAAEQLNQVAQTQNGTANIMETAVSELGTVL